MRGAVLFLSLCAATAGFAAAGMKWFEAYTFAGGSSNEIMLAWEVNETDGPPADFYEVVAAWFERPSLSRRYAFQADEVARNGNTVTAFMKMPGTGHFSFQVRSCLRPPAPDPPACSAWANSLDPTVSRVAGVLRAWWVYGYLEPPGGVIPIPASPGPTH